LAKVHSRVRAVAEVIEYLTMSCSLVEKNSNTKQPVIKI